MTTKQDFIHLREFFEKSENMGFFERLFSWGKFTSLRREAYAEFKAADVQLENVNEQLQNTNLKLQKLETTQEHYKETKANLEAEKKILESKKEELTTQVRELEKVISGTKKVEEKKQQDYEHKVTELNSLKQQLDEDRIRVQNEREREITERLQRLKETWKVHQSSVQETVKRICSRHTIEYIEKVPFKGDPDNTIKICEEHIIFDAKSPANDDLSNFPNYIRAQADAAKKYAKEKTVKKDIFLVIPANAAEVVNQTLYSFSDYDVHIITPNAIEPIILSLQKIEEYELAEQLKPEDRAQICRVIGQMAHTTKRRIQVDHYFAQVSLDILSKCHDLPSEILLGATAIEKNAMLNPPQDRRVKEIPLEELKKDNKRLKKEAEAKDIDTKADLKVIETVSLFRED